MSDAHKRIVREKLETIGYAVLDIPEGREPSADLSAFGPDNLVVEVKSRREDARIVRQLRAAARGQVIASHAPIVHDDCLSDLVHDAAKQIESSQKRYQGLGILWFRPDPELGIAHAPEKMLATLLGTRHVLVRNPEGLIAPGRCHLAANADFFRYKVLDLAVIEDTDDQSHLLVNPYSLRLDEARGCRLFRFVAEAAPGAILDVHELRESGRDYVLFGGFSRKDEAAALAELKGRYPNRDFQFFDMQGIAGYTLGNGMEPAT
jgi:hypothetical protein